MFWGAGEIRFFGRRRLADNLITRMGSGSQYHREPLDVASVWMDVVFVFLLLCELRQGWLAVVCVYYFLSCFTLNVAEGIIGAIWQRYTCTVFLCFVRLILYTLGTFLFYINTIGT